MTSTTHDAPAFGEADLSNCEREQIQFPGSIQPHGALLVLDDDATTIIQASGNAGACLALEGPIVGRAVATLPGTIAQRVRAHLGEPLHRRPVTMRCTVGEPAIEMDGLVHRPAQGGLIVELEPADLDRDVHERLESIAQTILGAASLKTLADETAALVQDLTGYDRVMVYRFDEHGHGEVFAERRRPDLEAFLGNRYPASDIPRTARRLYLQTRVRVLVDVDHEPVPLVPRLSPVTGRDLDMSMCVLRSMSPIHLQYLRNMGVSATLVVSLVVGGELWGLIACHHYAPRVLRFALRSASELVAELVATRIAALESFVQAQSELTARRLEQRMVEAVGRDGDWRVALFDRATGLLQCMGATGAALLYEGDVRAAGEVPATRDIRSLGAWLDEKRGGPIVATASLGLDEPDFAPLREVATGVLATPISAAGDYLLWFRPERIRTVTWGGDPTKPVVVGADPRQLSPRLSFAQWHQVVEGTSDPWTHADRTTARLIADTVSDMVLQFRSVRMLIVQNELDALSQQVRRSSRPIVLADPAGRIVLTNEAFERLLPPGHPSLMVLEDLPQFFAEPLGVRRALLDLLGRDRAWRGDVAVETIGDASTPLTVRGEAVYASLDRKLGYMLHFGESAERKSAETARRRFHDSMIDHQIIRSDGLDPVDDRALKSLLAPVVENAQLAALEITYGADPDRMATLLETVRASVGRTADLIAHLIRHAGDARETP